LQKNYAVQSGSPKIYIKLGFKSFIMYKVNFVLLLGFSFVFSACHDSSLHSNQRVEIKPKPKYNQAENEAEFTATLEKHLNAVSTRNLSELSSTLSPDGDTRLILVSRELTDTNSDFMAFHEEWFQDTTWTFDTKIKDIEVSEKMGLAIVEALYKEPRGNKEPYTNRLAVSYVLKKINGMWYVINDQSCSIEKTGQ